MNRYHTFLRCAWLRLALAALSGSWCAVAAPMGGTRALPAPPPPRAFGVYIRDRLAGYYGEARAVSFLEDRLAEVLFTRSVLRTGPEGPTLRDAVFWMDMESGRVRRARIFLRRPKH